MYGNSIYWKSKKQNIVTKSSAEAQYVALSVCVSEIKLIKELLLKDFEIKIKKPICIYEDNAGAISISKYGNFTINSKYVETHYHFVNENYSEGVINISKIDSKENPADIFTKSLGRIKFEKRYNPAELEPLAQDYGTYSSLVRVWLRNKSHLVLRIISINLLGNNNR